MLNCFELEAGTVERKFPAADATVGVGATGVE